MVGTWMPIETAPVDGRFFRARGRDWGNPDGKFHYAEAQWGVQHEGESLRFVDRKREQLVYLTDWKPLEPQP